MAAQSVAFLERANWLTPLDTVAWDSGWLLSDKSIAGRAMPHLDRLYRSADGDAAFGLSGRACRDRHADGG